uniref:HEAT repeat-containing protein 1 n=1 Tax=Salarias fasciatus TaxID=181472 RepID=A0A672FD37_SALFA
SSSSSQLSLRLASLRSTLATRLPPRVLLPTLKPLLQQHGLGALMSILKDFHQSELTAFFLTALDFRAQHCQGDLEKTSQVEGSVIDALVAMVMKLSEVTFRPLFFKLCDWSKSSSSERLLTFFRLCDRIAERLKGLFVLFAGNLVKPFSELLRRSDSAHTDDPLFTSDSGEQKTCLLLRYVLDCLHKLFLYDTQRFLSAERGHAPPRLENMVGGEQEYQQRVTQHLLPCGGQFSVALADDSQCKTLNYQILLKTQTPGLQDIFTQHTPTLPPPQVRFSSLLMLMEVASKLKENYMVLLPETIPFLAELMEDECEEVEQQVQKVVQEMENILGEPLQSYF